MSEGGESSKDHAYYSVYDAHAGRIRRRRHEVLSIESNHNIQPPLAPEEFLLKRHNRLLSYPFIEPSELPCSELVTAIHFYLSQKCQENGREDLLHAFDETALLAIAIELEEKIKENLGPNGHLAFAKPKSKTDEDYENE